MDGWSSYTPLSTSKNLAVWSRVVPSNTFTLDASEVIQAISRSLLRWTGLGTAVAERSCGGVWPRVTLITLEVDPREFTPVSRK